MVPSKERQEVWAQVERQGASADLRARFMAVSEQVANELAALARSATHMRSAERTAILSAAAQIAKTQERLCAETARAPVALEPYLGVMQDLLDGQQDLLDGLLHLGVIVRQQVPNGLEPELIVRWQIARSQIARLTSVIQEQQGPGSTALLTRLTSGLQERVSGDAPYFQARVAHAQVRGNGSVAAGRRRQTNSGVVRARQSAQTLVKTMVSLSLSVIAAFGGGLLVNYAHFPSASTQPESAAKRLNLPRPNMVAATPLPVPSADPLTSTKPSPWVMPTAPSVSASASMEPSYHTQGPRTQLSPPATADASARPGSLIGSPANTEQWPAIGPSAAPSFPEVRVGAAATPPGQNRLSPTLATRSAPEEIAAATQFVPVVFTHKDRTTATRAYSDLRQRYATLLKRRQSEVQPVEVYNKGTWHRVVVLPAGSRQQASALCAQLTAVGYDRCWVKPY